MAKPDSWKGAPWAGHLAPPTPDCFTHHVAMTRPASRFLQGSLESLLVRVYGRHHAMGRVQREETGGWLRQPQACHSDSQTGPERPLGSGPGTGGIPCQCLTAALPQQGLHPHFPRPVSFPLFGSQFPCCPQLLGDPAPTSLPESVAFDDLSPHTQSRIDCLRLSLR